MIKTSDLGRAGAGIEAELADKRLEELQKRVKLLETEVESLKDCIKIQSKLWERIVSAQPPTSIDPYYSKEPIFEPPYKVTCGGEE